MRPKPLFGKFNYYEQLNLRLLALFSVFPGLLCFNLNFPEIDQTHLSSFMWLYCEVGFPGGSAGKESALSAGDLGLIPGLGRSPGQGNGYPLQYSCLENFMDRGA